MTTSNGPSRPSSQASRENFHGATAHDELDGSVTPSSFSRTVVSESTPLLQSKSADRARGHTFSEVREEAWFMLRFAAPVFGTQVLEYSLMIASVIAIGHISTDALAAATLGSMTASVSGLSVIHGFTCALDSLLPQAWASDRPQHVGLWTQRMIVLLSMIIIPIIALWLNAEWILLRLRQEPEIAHIAAIYLRWSSLGLPGQATSVILRRYFQAQGLMHVPTMIMLFIAPLNAFLCWLLVWGPAPVNLGFIGAPIASSLCFNLMALISIIYARFFIPQTAWHPINSLCLKELGKLFRLGISGVGQTASEWWSWEIIVFAASQLGPAVLAAQSVLAVSSTLAFETPFSLGLATTVRVGNMLGSGQGQRAKLAAETSIGISLITALIMSSIFMIFRKDWGRLFNDDEEVVGMVAAVLPLVALFQIFDGATTVSNSVLRARGMLGVGAIINVCSYYVIGIPLGIWLAFWAGQGLHGLWIGLATALFCAAMISLFVVYNTDWDREVVRTRERLGQEDQNEVPSTTMV